MKNFQVHPISEKLIKEGHPWITLDRFSAKFPSSHELIELLDKNRKKLCVAINDPEHVQIKARVWSVLPSTQSFEQELKGRLEQAFLKRSELKLSSEREDFYWFFGEADQLPGLFGLQLKNVLLLQLYSTFWKKYLPLIQAWAKSKNHQIDCWVQERGTTQQLPHRWNEKKSELIFSLKEFDVEYEIRLGQTYDFGLYPDMAAIRKKIAPSIPIQGTILNLFSYTGAWSLFALKCGASHVTSIDLSGPYLQWLETNLKMNQWSSDQKHESLECGVDQGLDTLLKQEKKFDLILCDPPSASSDGKKITSAIKKYEELLPKISALLQKKGKVLLFLNTHSITSHKFKATIEQINQKNNLGLSLLGMVGTSEDCPIIKNFPEGNYLKGLFYQKG